jgi:arylsulfatase A-like enzyme
MPVRNGAEPNHAKPDADIKKLPAYLQELGYEVAAFGKVAHYNDTKLYGFDHAAHLGFHDDVAIAEGVKWLRERESEKPLCLFLGTNWPHTPWPGPSNDYPQEEAVIPPEHVDTPATRRSRSRYYAAVEKMDQELGMAYDAALEVLGDDVFFLHTSDHGSKWPFAKWSLYEDGIRTPLIVSWPGRVEAEARTDAMVSWVDLLPTLVDLAGGEKPEDLDGRSFLPVLRGEKENHRQRIFTTHSGDGRMNIYPIRSVRTSRWKYIRNLHPEYFYCTHTDLVRSKNSGDYFTSWERKAETDPLAAAVLQRYHQHPAEELYDLSADPLELRNLASDPEHCPHDPLDVPAVDAKQGR